MSMPTRFVAITITFLVLSACTGGGSSGGNPAQASNERPVAGSGAAVHSDRVTQTNQANRSACSAHDGNSALVLSGAPYNLQGMPIHTEIITSFCSPVGEANGDNFVVYGSQSGLHGGSYSGADG